MTDALHLRPHATGFVVHFRRISTFGAVGLTGLVVNSAALALFAGALHVHYLAGAILATQASTLWNFALAERFVFSSADRRFRRHSRLLRFLVINNAFLAARGPVLVLMVDVLGTHYLIANLATLAGTFVLRYVVADRVIWAPTPARIAPSPAAAITAPVTWTRVAISRSALAVFLAAGVGASAGLRLWSIGAHGYNSDEAVYAGQGLAMLGDATLAEHFSLFRAHPLVLQLVVGAAGTALEPSDAIARATVAILFGCGSVVVSYLLAARLCGRRVAVVAALVLAALPYHVIVSRQVMVDAPMGFFMVLCIWLMVRARTGAGDHCVVLAFVALGLATLSKEVAVLGLVPLCINLWQHQGRGSVHARTTWVGAALFAAVVIPFPATRMINQPKNAGDFVLWQLLRDPNHPPEYFLRVLLQFGGPAFLVLSAVGVWVWSRDRSAPERVLLPWAVTFLVFFNLWPTKLFPYLFPILPLLAIAAAAGLVSAVSALGRVLPSLAARSGTVFLGAGLVLSSSLAVASVRTIGAGPAAQVPGLVHFDIEVQTFAGGREVGTWIRDHTPGNARLLTIGPSIGNIVRFYGDRDSVALSVSTDPAKRNPAYVPVANPDHAIRNMDVQYALWDAYSADRSAFYNGRLMRYVRKYRGVAVFSAYVDPDGRLRTVEGPAPDAVDDLRAVVYDLQGGNPTADDEANG